jgi:CDP-paratose 2-epimerase
MRILITGVCGFVGSSLARGILESNEGVELYGIDNYKRLGAWNNFSILKKSHVKVRHGDIRIAADIDDLPRCDVVIDAAAMPSVLAGLDGDATPRQLLQSNLGGTINQLEYCRRNGSTFILLSSSRVYSIGELGRLRISSFVAELQNGYRMDRFEPTGHLPFGITKEGIQETFSTEPPLSLYGCSKRASELLALEYREQFGFPVWINRCGVLAGSGQFGHPGQGIVAYWIHAYREGRKLCYIGFNGQGHQVRDVLHPHDLVELINCQIHANGGSAHLPHLVNVGGGQSNSFSLAELNRWCANRFPSHSSGLPESIPETRPCDLPWVVLDCRLAQQHWNWSPKTTAKEIFEEIATFAEDNPDWLSRFEID